VRGMSQVFKVALGSKEARQMLLDAKAHAQLVREIDARKTGLGQV